MHPDHCLINSTVDETDSQLLIARSMESEQSDISDKHSKSDGCNQLNSIETTLFLQNHEKISLISSLGPIDKLERAQSISSIYSEQRQCRICLLCNETRRKRLISPCRCCGSVKYCHQSCLVRWIDASSKRMCPARCELCGYTYKRRGCLLSFDPFHIQIPKIGLRDKILNFLFILLLLIMSFCSWVSLHYLGLSIKRTNAFRVSNSLIGEDDVTMLASSLLFFIAFGLALFTQYRAEHSILHILVRCWNTNRNWQICEYDPKQDTDRKSRVDGRFIIDKSYC